MQRVPIPPTKGIGVHWVDGEMYFNGFPYNEIEFIDDEIYFNGQRNPYRNPYFHAMYISKEKELKESYLLYCQFWRGAKDLSKLEKKRFLKSAMGVIKRIYYHEQMHGAFYRLFNKSSPIYYTATVRFVAPIRTRVLKRERLQFIFGGGCIRPYEKNVIKGVITALLDFNLDLIGQILTLFSRTLRFIPCYSILDYIVHLIQVFIPNLRFIIKGKKREFPSLNLFQDREFLLEMLDQGSFLFEKGWIKGFE